MWDQPSCVLWTNSKRPEEYTRFSLLYVVNGFMEISAVSAQHSLRIVDGAEFYNLRVRPAFRNRENCSRHGQFLHPVIYFRNDEKPLLSDFDLHSITG